jgi:hypothetical protein
VVQVLSTHEGNGKMTPVEMVAGIAVEGIKENGGGVIQV